MEHRPQSATIKNVPGAFEVMRAMQAEDGERGGAAVVGPADP
jgi:hypothetical protein